MPKLEYITNTVVLAYILVFIKADK